MSVERNAKGEATTHFCPKLTKGYGAKAYFNYDVDTRSATCTKCGEFITMVARDGLHVKKEARK